MSYQCIKLNVEDRVGRLSLARPDELNAVNPQMIEEVIDALGSISAMEDVKALVVTGEGRAFCAGADLTYLDSILGEQKALSSYLGEFNSMLFALEELPIPVIGLVHGYALAGGLEILLACDLVIAAEDARIGDQHINYALIPGGGSTQRLPCKVGHQRALELLFTGRWMTGGGSGPGWAGAAGRSQGPPGRRAGILAADAQGQEQTCPGPDQEADHGGRLTPHLREGIAQETSSFRRARLHFTPSCPRHCRLQGQGAAQVLTLMPQASCRKH